ncbi:MULTISPECIES: rhomboid family intramembrane serine protease [Pseudonocardia]|uniref:Membrane associated serine protease, rhomboid family n=1 Tax=Pseudonocardia oroxyli TaxID=366584 RepID=A0A1G7LWS0_PSEOR|nr:MULTISPECIES: rhomboid family intramembrane serine protease [Pseudonocardia]MCF7551910.1 rhomboid family intramembrane serine protease [Pseudonocardia sp. WMMC193]SDF53390.1 Membrane associated serine protease, rhomboid family [Pseudonocardia oroxyli]
MTAPQLPGCVRHPDRPTGLSCTRCGRPACPECLRDAPVGRQCVDCVHEGQRTVRRGRTVAGASRGGRRPVVVPVLTALNVALFVLTAAQAGSIGSNNRSALFQEWVLVPGLVAGGDWWRPLTSGFLHYGPLHLVFNMLALWWLGRELEPVLGRARFLAVYLVSLLGGSAAVMLFSPANSLVAGASGAVFGLMGAMFVIIRRLQLPAGQIVGLVVVNLVISVVVPGISLMGHVGGLLLGAAATALLVSLRDRRTLQLSGLAVLTLVVLTVIATRAAAVSFV